MTPRRRAFADSKPALAPGASKSYSLPFPMPDLVAITGAAGALGSEVARHLVARGYRAVLLGSSRSAGDLHALARSLDAAFAVEADVATKAGWDKALEAIQREAGSLPSHAVLVAGGWQGGKPLHDVADASHDAVWSAMIESNLETVHQSLRALLPDMVARGRGSIVVIGSRVVERPWTGAGAAAYAASKAAAVELAQVAAAEVLTRVCASTPCSRAHSPRPPTSAITPRSTRRASCRPRRPPPSSPSFSRTTPGTSRAPPSRSTAEPSEVTA